MVLAFVVHEEAGNVLGVVEIAHGAEGNDDEAIVVIIAVLDFTLIDSHDFKADAVDADVLSQRRLPGEEAASGFVADHGHAGALKLIFGSDAARVEVSDETREALISLGWTPPAR